MKKSPELERDAALQVAGLMAAAARTAPKTRGIDNIELFVVEDVETKGKICQKMKEIAQREELKFLERDANCIAGAPAILVVGVMSNPGGLNCAYCGHSNCEDLKASGGVCSFNAIDLGIAISSAAALASQFHIDNRVMYSVGRACLELGLFGPSVKLALALPLSVTGKSPFFDRK